jgi:hypothetical protein
VLALFSTNQTRGNGKESCATRHQGKRQPHHHHIQRIQRISTDPAGATINCRCTTSTSSCWGEYNCQSHRQGVEDPNGRTGATQVHGHCTRLVLVADFRVVLQFSGFFFDSFVRIVPILSPIASSFELTHRHSAPAQGLAWLCLQRGDVYRGAAHHIHRTGDAVVFRVGSI